MTAACDWTSDHIGANPYTGSIAAAVSHYRDIPVETRLTLIARMERHQYDGIVQIGNATPLSRMHFGAGKECATITRNWRTGFTVSALRYTQDGYTILYPEPCRNIVRSVYAERGVAPDAVVLDDSNGPVLPPILPGYIPGAPLIPTPPAAFGDYGAPAPGFGGVVAGGSTVYVLSATCTCCGSPIAAVVPEPATFALFGAGLAAIWIRRRG